MEISNIKKIFTEYSKQPTISKKTELETSVEKVFSVIKKDLKSTLSPEKRNRVIKSLKSIKFEAGREKDKADVKGSKILGWILHPFRKRAFEKMEKEASKLLDAVEPGGHLKV